jgi:aminopeptidase N
VRVEWTARVPRPFARTGAIGDFYFIAQWFPKVAKFEDEGWRAHQFHANSEFYSDYGRYDVRITVPRGWTVGATGTNQRDERANGDDTVTYRFAQDDVHDFAWTASPEFVEHRETFRHQGLPPVEMRLLLQREHRGQEDRHFAATRAALRYYGEWYGPYPYGHVTIVDPAFQSEAGGMEYPTLFTAGTRLFAPRGSNSPEAVTVHEAGHQFWFGIVGNNEFEHAWMDEGINQFSEARVLGAAFQPDYHVERFFGGFIPWQIRDIQLTRETDGNYLDGYRMTAESDAMNKPTFRYHPVTHWGISYAKAALWLNTLERYLGWDTLQRVLKTHFQRSAFKHPTPDDFFRTLNEVSGRDLTWMVDQVYRSSNVFDYAVETLTSDAAADNRYRTTVVVRRHGEAIFPVDVRVRFENGQELREQWDGVDRWTTFTYTRPERATSAEVDPDRVLLLDVNYTNNSRTLAPRAGEAAQKWSLLWMLWLQDLMLTWSFFV